MEKIIEAVNENYGLNINRIEKHKNVYKIETDNGAKCFKFSKYDQGQFQFIINSIGYLINNGFRHILQFEETNEGEKYIKLENGYGFLCRWIDSQEADFNNPFELKLCVEALGELHSCSRDLSVPNIPRCRIVYKRWIEKFKKRCDELLYFKALAASKERKSDFDILYNKYFDIHYYQALKSIKSLENSNYFDIMEKNFKLSKLCHHDTANHNFLITGEHEVYMIDFDYCIIDSYIHDLASIIIRCLKYGKWSMNTLNFVLDCYSKNITVDDDDLYMIFCFIQFPQDFWQVGLQYYVERQPWSEEFFTKKLHRITQDSSERMDFISQFQSSFSEVANGYH